MVTPGMDSFSGYAQGGGIGSVAQNVADRNERESGLEALQAVQGAQHQQLYNSYDRDYSREASPYPQQPPSHLLDRASYGSNMGLAAGAATPGTVTPDLNSSRYSARSIPLDDYPSHSSQYGYNQYDSPYQGSRQNFQAVNDASINPHNIVDDGDDGFMPDPQRKSMFGNNASRGPAAAAGSAGVLGGVFGRKQKAQASSVSYDPVGLDGSAPPRGEKSEWLSRQKKGSNKMRWIVGVAIGLVIVIAIVAGIVGGVLGNKNSGGSGGGAAPGSTNNADTDYAQNGDLDLNSAEIKNLLNNKDLHKVFPAMDYTPWGTQYPLCMTYPPSQNNVTRDMAVLSQLTNQVRLYGTDCNQTEMVLHAIDRLKLDDMKVWLGVWIDSNQTTSDRQMKKMYNILEDVSDHSIFKGVIIGNEALYRAGEDKTQSEQELITLLTETRQEFSTRGYDLKIATSDLGDNWTSTLAAVVDYVMSNIHPFFAGVTAEAAAGWTWDFWNSHDVVLTKGNPNIGQIISETGWPSGGGTDCGGADGTCAPGQNGAVASVENMNVFMNDWVCQAMENGTDYFW
jgi:exo-beta-1,3-glucanase (GH17 family)